MLMLFKSPRITKYPPITNASARNELILFKVKNFGGPYSGLSKKSFLTAKPARLTPFGRVHKEGAKFTKGTFCISVLCDLCVSPLRPLWLMDFYFLYTPKDKPELTY
jgi:hypothetical protein